MADSEARQALLRLEAFLEGDRSMGDMDQVLPALDAYLRVFAAPGFVCAMVPIPPGPVAEYEGVDGVTRAWRDWGATFETIRADAEEIRETDERRGAVRQPDRCDQARRRRDDEAERDALALRGDLVTASSSTSIVRRQSGPAASSRRPRCANLYSGDVDPGVL